MALSAKPTEVKAWRFRFFISYAREDYNIAIAVNNAIQTAAGPAAEVFMDVALQFGLNFQEEIKSRLDQTNVFVVIHSGILRSAFEFPGLELGYFLRVMESEPSLDFPRRIVPIYRELSVAVGKSEIVALRHPIMPVGYGFGGRVVGVNGGQL